MNIGSYAFDEYLQVVKSFHGHLAPGMIIGGVMVDLAQRQLAPEVLYDAVCETRNCLPDAVQLLTPCTIGNGWLKVVNIGRFALTLYDKYEGEGVACDTPPREGKVNLLAKRHGLFTVNEDRLQVFNLVPGVMCACRHGHTVVPAGRLLAGTRAIPLHLPRRDFHKAMAILADGPLFQVLPLKPARVGVLVTGTEVFLGLVEDRFIPIVQNKVGKFGCELAKSLIVPDDRRAIRTGIRELLDYGVNLLVTTAGLSVDPDDVTRQGLLDAGATDMLYGAPILPGAMTLLARIGAARVIGVPACALYFKRTSFDLILPRLLAGLEVRRRDLAKLGHGALCLECQTCSFPKCPFGR